MRPDDADVRQWTPIWNQANIMTIFCIGSPETNFGEIELEASLG